MFPLSCARARARTTFRPARTAFTYWPMLSIGHECYCSRGRPMRARRNKIRGNIVRKWHLSVIFMEKSATLHSINLALQTTWLWCSPQTKILLYPPKQKPPTIISQTKIPRRASKQHTAYHYAGRLGHRCKTRFYVFWYFFIKYAFCNVFICLERFLFSIGDFFILRNILKSY